MAPQHERTMSDSLIVSAERHADKEVLVISGTDRYSYGQLLDYVVFADWIFFGLTAATLFVYRRREARGAFFRAPLHPWSTGLFMLAASYVVLGAIVSNPMNAMRGTLVLAAGVPVYLWWRRGAGRPDTSTGPRA